ncbi:MAG TPA: DUF192 domain-containing protein [Nitrososphaeraceae archaeon]
MIKLLRFLSLSNKLLTLKILNVSLLGFLLGFLFQYSLTVIETEKLFVFAYQNNSIQDTLTNTHFNDSNYLKGYVIIDHFKIFVDIALTDKQKQDGLSVKNFMNENEGMLFFLGDPTKASFWMKNMHFPIDIIWLDENFSIVHIEKELKPCTMAFYCPSYKPLKESLYVLETIAGFANNHHLNIGDRIDFQLME